MPAPTRALSLPLPHTQRALMATLEGEEGWQPSDTGALLPPAPSAPVNSGRAAGLAPPPSPTNSLAESMASAAAAAGAAAWMALSPAEEPAPPGSACAAWVASAAASPAPAHQTQQGGRAHALR